MILENAGRLVVCCNNCPVRLDLGPSNVARARNRTPSGWINAGRDRHFCPRCSPQVTLALVAEEAKGVRPQPLV